MDHEEFFLSPSSSPRPQTRLIPNTPIQALRFIDTLDCHFWASNNEFHILDPQTPPPCFTTEAAIAWYHCFIFSRPPGNITVGDLRRTLMRDFDVDADTSRYVLSRYSVPGKRSSGNRAYYQTQSFKVIMSYLDEIEGLREQLKFRNRKAVEDRKELDHVKETWKTMLVKEHAKHAAQMKEKQAVVTQLEKKVMELESAVKGLTKMVSEHPPITRTDVGDAVSRFQDDVWNAAERLKETLAQKLPKEPSTDKAPHQMESTPELGNKAGVASESHVRWLEVDRGSPSNNSSRRPLERVVSQTTQTSSADSRSPLMKHNTGTKA